MKRKRILTVLIVLALVFIWGNSLVSRELSGKISDDILFFLNAAAEKVGLGPDAFTYMTDEDGDGVAEQPTSHLIRKAAHVTEYAVFAALLFLRLESAGKKRFFTAWGLGTLTGAIDETLQIFSHQMYITANPLLIIDFSSLSNRSVTIFGKSFPYIFLAVV